LARKKPDLSNVQFNTGFNILENKPLMDYYNYSNNPISVSTKVYQEKAKAKKPKSIAPEGPFFQVENNPSFKIDRNGNFVYGNNKNISKQSNQTKSDLAGLTETKYTGGKISGPYYRNNNFVTNVNEYVKNKSNSNTSLTTSKVLNTTMMMVPEKKSSTPTGIGIDRRAAMAVQAARLERDSQEQGWWASQANSILSSLNVSAKFQVDLVTGMYQSKGKVVNGKLTRGSGGPQEYNMVTRLYQDDGVEFNAPLSGNIPKLISEGVPITSPQGLVNDYYRRMSLVELGKTTDIKPDYDYNLPRPNTPTSEELEDTIRSLSNRDIATRQAAWDRVADLTAILNHLKSGSRRMSNQLGIIYAKSGFNWQGAGDSIITAQRIAQVESALVTANDAYSKVSNLEHYWLENRGSYSQQWDVFPETAKYLNELSAKVNSTGELDPGNYGLQGMYRYANKVEAKAREKQQRWSALYEPTDDEEKSMWNDPLYFVTLPDSVIQESEQYQSDLKTDIKNQDKFDYNIEEGVTALRIQRGLRPETSDPITLSFGYKKAIESLNKFANDNNSDMENARSFLEGKTNTFETSMGRIAEYTDNNLNIVNKDEFTKFFGPNIDTFAVRGIRTIAPKIREIDKRENVIKTGIQTIPTKTRTVEEEQSYTNAVSIVGKYNQLMQQMQGATHEVQQGTKWIQVWGMRNINGSSTKFREGYWPVEVPNMVTVYDPVYYDYKKQVDELTPTITQYENEVQTAKPYSVADADTAIAKLNNEVKILDDAKKFISDETDTFQIGDKVVATRGQQGYFIVNDQDLFNQYIGGNYQDKLNIQEASQSGIEQVGLQDFVYKDQTYDNTNIPALEKTYTAKTENTQKDIEELNQLRRSQITETAQEQRRYLTELLNNRLIRQNAYQAEIEKVNQDEKNGLDQVDRNEYYPSIVGEDIQIDDKSEVQKLREANTEKLNQLVQESRRQEVIDSAMGSSGQRGRRFRGGTPEWVKRGR